MSLPAGAATFTVTNLNDSSPGSLRQAILDANDNLSATHTIAFQPGLTGTITLTGGEIVITGRMTINGPGESVLAVSGNNAHNVFSISSLGTTISGLTIKEGNQGIINSGYLTLSNLTLSANNATYSGGGIFNTGDLTLSDITLSDNKAPHGGGIYNTGGSLTATRLTLSGNEAVMGYGGGIHSDSSDSVTVSDSTFINNRASHGGGVYLYPGAITISNSTLSGNQATSGNGGGIHVGGTLTVTNSTLFENSASGSGGGIYHGAGTLTVTNSTLSGNVVNGSGGGIYCFDTTTIANSTLSGNMAITSGGGILSSVLTLGNSIVTGNTALAAGNLRTDGLQGGRNLFGENGIAGVEGATPLASEIIAGPVSSVIRPLADNGGPTKTHAPVPGGPAMDAGDNSLIPAGVTTDQRGAGFPRLVNATVDIGAVEGFTPPSTTGGGSFSVMNNASRTLAYTTGLNSMGQLGAGLVVPSRVASVQPQAYFGRSIYPIRVSRSWRSTRQFQAATTAAPLAAVDTTDFIAIASAAAHTIALRGDGTVWAWGNNANGQLGDGTTTTAYEPVQVLRDNSKAPLTDVVAVAAGRNHSVAVKSDGTVWSWGNNAYGQLGDNSSNTMTRFYPVQVVTNALTPLDKVRMVAASDVHTLALKADGTVWAWGDNARGALGTGDTTVQRTATQVSVLNDVLAIMARGTDLTARSLAQRADNSLWGWGDNSHCQLGDTAAALGNPIVAPARLDNLSTLGVSAGQIANGESHGVARKSDGAVWAWGLNNQGQVGDGTTTNRCAPVQVAGISGVVETVGTGVDHSFVTTTDGSVWGWGSNNEGQLGVGDTNRRLTPTQMAGENGEGYLNLKVEPTTYLLAVNTTGTGNGTVSGAGDYEAGATVTLTATPNAGSTFAGWSPSPPCAASFPMPANALTCTATFTLATQPGDVNGDSKVDALDVVATINAVLGLSSSSAADVNGDGAVNALDVVFVINKVLGL